MLLRTVWLGWGIRVRETNRPCVINFRRRCWGGNVMEAHGGGQTWSDVGRVAHSHYAPPAFHLFRMQAGVFAT